MTTVQAVRSNVQAHHLRSIPETMHWGFFDPKLKPVLTIKSGERVIIDTISGNPEMMPPPELGMSVLAEQREVHQKVPKGSGNHLFTGPIYIEEAEPGDVLEVSILDIELRQDWGWNIFRGLVGTLPEEYPLPPHY